MRTDMKKKDHLLRIFRGKILPLLLIALSMTLTTSSWTMAQETAKKTEKKATTGQPVASFSKQMFNFGSLVDGEKVVHDFVIKNTGKAVLEIQKVKTA